MSTDKQESFQSQLEAVYKRYQNQSLEDRLDDVAETMEETILQRALAEELLRTDAEIEEDAKQAVRDAEQLVGRDDYEALDETLDGLEQVVEDQERQVSNQIQKARISMSKTVQGMIRLNERVDRVNEAKVQSIKVLLEDWDWKGQVYRDAEDAGIKEHKQQAAEYGRDMRRFFEEARESTFGPYNDTPLEEIVDKLLDEERFTLASLTDEQLRRLRESDLPDYVGLELA
jgi:hypothetical protein